MSDERRDCTGPRQRGTSECRSEIRWSRARSIWSCVTVKPARQGRLDRLSDGADGDENKAIMAKVIPARGDKAVTPIVDEVPAGETGATTATR